MCYFRIYLCCGKHRDLVWKKYEPEPQYPQRPLRITINEGVVTIDSTTGSINEFNQDEVSLQPSIVPITRKPTVRYGNYKLIIIIIINLLLSTFFVEKISYLLHNQIYS